MTGIDQVKLDQVIVHRVGNPTRGEQLKLSNKTLTLNDELVNSMLSRYFLHSINEHDQYQFTHVSNIELNEVYNYARYIFAEPDTFLTYSAHIAQYLYSRSTHNRVKEGELYVALLRDVPFENEFVTALGLFKSETKDTFLRVFEHGTGLEVSGEEGININKLDKGCLIFNTNTSEGFRVCVVDNTNKQNDAQYWVKDFLHVSPVSNEYFNTTEYLSLCKQFATEELPEHFEVTKGQQIDLMQRSLEYFKENDQFELQGFANEVIHHPEMVDKFMSFKDNYQKSKHMEFDESFDINLSAVKHNQKAFKSILKLDKNFSVYVHGRRDMMERGFDDATGKSFYKLYFDTEA